MASTNKIELVGVKEIARRAKVSIATVDRVLHNRYGVSEKTKKKINLIIQELDYKPNILARYLASKKLVRLAVLIPATSIETEYWAAPLRGIQQAEAEIKAYGIRIKYYFFDQDDKSSFLKQTELILRSSPHGILLAPMFIGESRNFAAKCDKKNIPYVFINSDIPNQKSLCYIGPHLYHAGYQGAHLANYLLKEDGRVLIVNISKEMDSYHHLLRKEEGFRAYFADNNPVIKLVKLDIRQTNYKSIKEKLSEFLATHPVDVIFVTNSRVSLVAHYLEEENEKNVKLIGFDFIQENIEYLKKKTIDFLICQKPQEQGYRGTMALFNHLVHSFEVEPVYYMPIDIITKENYSFYRN